MTQAISPGADGRRGTYTLPASASVDRLRASTTRRRLQVALGLIWLVDAALQYQPYMFARSFVTQTLEPAATGTPWWVARPSLWAAHLMLGHLVVYNTLFATVQLVIALGLLCRPLVRWGLAVSVVWSLAVWWLGEGIGGITVGASAVAGAPGAVILYALVALMVWPRRGVDAPLRAGECAADRGLLGPNVPRIAWAWLWFALAVLGLEAANRAPSALAATVSGMAAGEPGWIGSIDRALASPLAHHGTEVSIALAVLFVAVGLLGAGAVSRTLVRPALMVAVLLAAAIWAAEAFGGVFTGSGTDVNSGPLLAFFAAVMWPRRRPDTTGQRAHA